MVKGSPISGSNAMCWHCALRRPRLYPSRAQPSAPRWQTRSCQEKRRNNGIASPRAVAVKTSSTSAENVPWAAATTLAYTSTKRRQFAAGTVGEPDCEHFLVARANPLCRTDCLSLKAVHNLARTESPRILPQQLLTRPIQLSGNT